MNTASVVTVLFYVLHILAQFGFIARVLLRPHREPTSRIAWVVIILALPLLGILAYILFGEVNIGQRRVARMRAVLAQMPKVADAIGLDEVLNKLPEE
ncbi:MAG TPA: PLDc N-terminal domain-containing protein, partial [Candidatus Competibacteraceae bacterium]|nr:PLDc N-terminal domain-containing protein [Candidatus Competibacteraceae bacterium]